MPSLVCQRCNYVFAGIVSLDERGNSALADDGPDVELAHDDSGKYVLCPKCEAKNIVVVATNDDVPCWWFDGLR